MAPVRPSLTTGATSVTYTVTFSESVAIVDAAEFFRHNDRHGDCRAVALVAAAMPLYGHRQWNSGSGSLRLNLVDNGSIKTCRKSASHVQCTSLLRVSGCVPIWPVPVYVMPKLKQGRQA